MKIGILHVDLVRRPRPRRASRRIATAVGTAVALVGLVGLAVPAGASGPGSVTASVSIALRSLSVSTASVAFGNCEDQNRADTPGLTFPNGSCFAPSLSVTNGPVASDIDVQATPFVPSDGGTPWSLCQAVAHTAVPGRPLCTGSAEGGSGQFNPGADEADIGGLSSSAGYTYGELPTCDQSIQPVCGTEVAAGTTTSIGMGLEGPATSTDPSSSFQTTVTWTALP